MKILFFFFITISITACGEKKANENTNDNNIKQEEKEFYEILPMPSNNIDKTIKNEKDNNQIEYILYINNYSYENFYNYIMKLEQLGYHYEFVNDSVPNSYDLLHDKTETSWSANDGKIWIRALWRSNENAYYSNYNLQLIFNNYNYINENNA